MTDKNTEFDRRVFMAGAVGAAATLGALGADAQQQRLPAEGGGGAVAAPTASRRIFSGRRGSIVSKPTSTIAR